MWIKYIIQLLTRPILINHFMAQSGDQSDEILRKIDFCLEGPYLTKLGILLRDSYSKKYKQTIETRKVGPYTLSSVSFYILCITFISPLNVLFLPKNFIRKDNFLIKSFPGRSSRQHNQGPQFWRCGKVSKQEVHLHIRNSDTIIFLKNIIWLLDFDMDVCLYLYIFTVFHIEGF